VKRKDSQWTPEEWVEEATCRQVGTELFFPPDDKPVPRDFYLRAKKVCRQCPVKDDCLDYGLDERYGVWGMTTPRERARIREAQETTDRATMASRERKG